VEDALRDAD
jgi:hypothetical protein